MAERIPITEEQLDALRGRSSGKRAGAGSRHHACFQPISKTSLRRPVITEIRC